MAILVIVLISGLLAPVGAEVLFANDKRILYTGRFQAEGQVRWFSWPGTQISARFTGTSIAASLSGSRMGERFLTLIDGKVHGAPFLTDKCNSQQWAAGCFKQYTLATGLAAGNHIVALWKISEDLGGTRNVKYGAARFRWLSATSFLSAPSPRPLRLHFVGDADTAGYCADGVFRSRGGRRASASWDDDEELKFDNTYKTWGAQIARSLNADFVATAMHGVSARKITKYWKNTLTFQSQAAPWDSSSWVPHAVVILIGANDCEGGCGRNFKTSYLAMMNSLVTAYASANVPPKLIHVCAGSGVGFEPCAEIQAVNNEFNKGRTDNFRGYYTSMTKATWDLINGPRGRGTTTYSGCYGYYNEQGHAKVASEILPQVQKILSSVVTARPSDPPEPTPAPTQAPAPTPPIMTATTKPPPDIFIPTLTATKAPPSNIATKLTTTVAQPPGRFTMVRHPDSSTSAACNNDVDSGDIFSGKRNSMSNAMDCPVSCLQNANCLYATWWAKHEYCYLYSGSKCGSTFRKAPAETFGGLTWRKQSGGQVVVAVAAAVFVAPAVTTATVPPPVTRAPAKVALLVARTQAPTATAKLTTRPAIMKIKTLTGSFVLKMSAANAASLTSDQRANLVLRKAVASTVGLNVNDVSIKAIYVNGVRTRRLQNSPQSRRLLESNVKIDFEVKTSKVVEISAISMSDLKTNVEKEAALIGKLIIITELPTINSSVTKAPDIVSAWAPAITATTTVFGVPVFVWKGVKVSSTAPPMSNLLTTSLKPTSAIQAEVTFSVYKTNYYCAIDFKGLHESAATQSIQGCADAVSADRQCSETFFARTSLCNCILQGKTCRIKPSSVGNTIYQIKALALVSGSTTRTMATQTPKQAAKRQTFRDAHTTASRAALRGFDRMACFTSFFFALALSW